jgi:glutamate-1-semialdehyde aminotransferase
VSTAITTDAEYIDLMCSWGPILLGHRHPAVGCGRRGLLLHPTYNWFLSTAHDDEAIDRALVATDEAFRAIRERDGAD